MRKLSKGSKSSILRRLLAVEPLERRTMLAGNVTVNVAGGNLIIRGDNADNCVLVYQVDDGEYAVTGFECEEGDDGTRVDGDENGTTVATGVTGNIDIDLRRGDDALLVGNIDVFFGDLPDDVPVPPEFELDPPSTGETMEVPRNLIINMSDGEDLVGVIADVRKSGIINTGNQDDLVGVIGGSFGTNLVISTGSGLDSIGVGSIGEAEDDTFIEGLLSINSGEGSDEVLVDGAEFGHAVVVTAGGDDDVIMEDYFSERAVVINTGGGSDLVDLFDFHQHGALTVVTADGNDDVFADDFSILGRVTVITGSGNDEVELTTFDAAGVLIDTGSGNDGTPDRESPITIDNAEIFNDRNDDGDIDPGEELGPVTVVTGSGEDFVEVNFIDAGNIVINTGSHDDEVAVYNSFVENNLTVITGSGNDFVELEGGDGGLLEVGNNVVLDTGAGNDFADLVDLIVGNNLTVLLGAGNDDLIVEDVDVDNIAHLDAGSGNDNEITVDNSIFRILRAFMGHGDDELTIRNSDADKFFLRGGHDFDILNFFGNTGELDEDEFEEVNFVGTTITPG